MITFTCPNCNTVGFIALVDNKPEVSPCNCVANTNNSACCNSPIEWLSCDGCSKSEERHDFAICSECGEDI